MSKRKSNDCVRSSRDYHNERRYLGNVRVAYGIDQERQRQLGRTRPAVTPFKPGWAVILDLKAQGQRMALGLGDRRAADQPRRRRNTRGGPTAFL
jgi:hypothetical protein